MPCRRFFLLRLQQARSLLSPSAQSKNDLLRDADLRRNSAASWTITGDCGRNRLPEPRQIFHQGCAVSDRNLCEQFSDPFRALRSHFLEGRAPGSRERDDLHPSIGWRCRATDMSAPNQIIGKRGDIALRYHHLFGNVAQRHAGFRLRQLGQQIEARRAKVKLVSQTTANLRFDE
jgi:hypothetical protein